MLRGNRSWSTRIVALHFYTFLSFASMVDLIFRLQKVLITCFEPPYSKGLSYFRGFVVGRALAKWNSWCFKSPCLVLGKCQGGKTQSFFSPSPLTSFMAQRTRLLSQFLEPWSLEAEGGSLWKWLKLVGVRGWKLRLSLNALCLSLCNLSTKFLSPHVIN